VGRGEVDVSCVTPGCAALPLVNGTGLFTGESWPKLRAIGMVPHPDRMLFAIRADTGITSVADIRRRKRGVRIATAPADWAVGLVGRMALERAGVSADKIRKWGGELLEFGHPLECVDAVATGRADAIIHEAIVLVGWHELAEEHDLNFLEFDSAVLATVQDQLGLPPATVKAGYMRGLDRDILAPAFEGFMVVVRADMADDVAYLLAWHMNERRALLEARYAHFPKGRSNVVVPIESSYLAATPITLHSGAERYFRERGVI
jgi:TRAP-type uncharacterized transport system substrate-binding protein